jgi:hypothetical protein
MSKIANSYEILMKICGSIDTSFVKSATSAANSLKGIESASKTTSKATSLLATGMGILGGYLTAGAIINGAKACVNASNEAATTTARLVQTMGNVKGTTPAMIQGIQAYSDALEKNTTISHVANDIGASQLATFQLSGSTIKQLLPTLDDLSAGQHGASVTSSDMVASANMIGKVMSGNVTSLKRMGVALSASQLALLQHGTQAQKTATLIDVLRAKYGGMAAAVRATPEGAVVALHNSLHDLEEAVGKQLTPVIVNLMNVLSKNLPAIQSGLVDTIKKIGPAIQTAGAIVVDIFSFVTEHGPAVLGIVAGIGGAFLAFKGIQGVISAVEGVTSVINKVGKAVNWLKKTQALQKIGQTAYNVAMATWSGICKLASVAQMAFNAVCDANPIALVVIGILAAIAVGILLWKNWSKITAEAKKLSADLEPIFTGIGQFVTNLANGVWNSIKGFIDLVIGGINGIVKGINSVSSVVGKATGLKLTIPTIPQLSSGGIIPATPGGILARLGEGGQSEAVVPLKNGAGVGGGTTINYNVQYSITGNASMNDIKQAGADVQRDFARWMNTWLKGQNRLSFAAS